jgi:hypothetical protein
MSETGGMTLADWLLAQIAEDEAVARAANASLSDLDCWAAVGSDAIAIRKYEVGAHIARHDPARVLAECASKRRIVELHPHTERVIAEGYIGANAGFGCEVCHDWDGVTEGLGNCDTLRALAQPYADRPGWQEGWGL